jgi:hypothetical protein
VVGGSKWCPFSDFVDSQTARSGDTSNRGTAQVEYVPRRKVEFRSFSYLVAIYILYRSDPYKWTTGGRRSDWVYSI